MLMLVVEFKGKKFQKCPLNTHTHKNEFIFLLKWNGRNISLKYYKGDISINPALIQLIEYPKKIGTHQSKDIIITVGPYGKYMKYNNKNIKIPQKDSYTYQECLGYL